MSLGVRVLDTDGFRDSGEVRDNDEAGIREAIRGIRVGHPFTRAKKSLRNFPTSRGYFTDGNES